MKTTVNRSTDHTDHDMQVFRPQRPQETGLQIIEITTHRCSNHRDHRRQVYRS